MRQTIEVTDLFEDLIALPDDRARERLDDLVGLDDARMRLVKEGRILLRPAELDEWSERAHRRIIPAISELRHRPPLIIFGGDVGSGKTTLAETFADPIARSLGIPAHVMRLSLRTRGTGAVGEMSNLLGAAFEEVRRRARDVGGGRGGAVVFVIDEADALAQARDMVNMHHEDRAGVNAVIRGIDQIGERRQPILVVMCTNRLDSLDAAIRRRAAVQFRFGRPNDEQRAAILRRAFEGVHLEASEYEELVRLTGPSDDRNYGFTFSDLRQRLVPAAVLEAFPDVPITGSLLLRVAQAIEPTRPFASSDGSAL